MKKRKLKKGFWIGTTVIAILLVVALTSFLFISSDFSFLSKKEVKEVEQPVRTGQPKRSETTASLVMVGDALIHSTLYENARQSDGSYDFRSMLTEVKPIIEPYDLAYYNQETILGGTSLGLSNYPRFNSPQEVGDAFLDAGFNLVSLASNHTMDKGEQGVMKSLDYWDSKDVYTAGSYRSFEDRDRVIIREINGITYSFLSYTMWNNGLRTPSGKEYLNNEYSEELVRADIERVRDQVDVVIVAMHWGIEYSHSVNWQQEEVANYLSSLGVDIIIGAHPHVVQPITFIGKTLVVYSLGNLISDQIGVERLTGLIASITIRKVVEDGVTTISLEQPKAELVYTYSQMRRDRAFKVYPYTSLNQTLLPNYRSYYERYKEIVTSMCDKIEMPTLS